MKLLTHLFILALSVFSSATSSAEKDPEMRKVSYTLPPNAFSIASYKAGTPSAFKVTLCSSCQQTVMELSKDAGLFRDKTRLTGQAFTEIALKKQFAVVRLGINRDKNQITFVNLASDFGEKLTPHTKPQ
jgi:hypothetical protein